MSILPKLVQIYKSGDLDILSGYNSYHFDNWRDAPFTIMKDKVGYLGCPGLALQEVMFLEHLGKYISPKNCFVIGNAMGWSTIATGLTFPQSFTLGLDNENQQGIDFTNIAFKILKLNGGAAQGTSPMDVTTIVNQNFEGPLDFVLIDAMHTNEAMKADFLACQEKASKSCVYVFHDVINWNMQSAFAEIKEQSGLEGHILTRTPSGMAILYPNTISKAFKDYIAVFTDDFEELQTYKDFIREQIENNEKI